MAICDVDRTRLAKALAKYKLPENRGFTDFRRMLDTVKEIEACTVSTADHAHFPAAMHAISLGKHVCVQKPLVNTLWQAQEMLKAARKKRVVTNMGNQGHTGEGLRLLKEWVSQGAIGKVKEVHVRTNRPVWPQGLAAKYARGNPTPATLDWEAWQAGASESPYIDGLHPFAWRGSRIYGAGAMGDMGCHLLDGPFWALDLGAPSKITADRVHESSPEAYPKGSVVSCHFPKQDILLRWYEGRDAEDKKPAQPAEYDRKSRGEKSAAALSCAAKRGSSWTPRITVRNPNCCPRASIRISWRPIRRRSSNVPPIRAILRRSGPTRSRITFCAIEFRICGSTDGALSAGQSRDFGWRNDRMECAAPERQRTAGVGCADPPARVWFLGVPGLGKQAS